jgi:YfiH family protein
MIHRAARVLTLSGQRIPHGVSARNTDWPENGNMSFTTCESPQAASANRARFVRDLGLDPAKLQTGKQVHGTDIHLVEVPGDDPCEPGEVDGLLTDQPGVPIGILVADCCCLLMADVEGKAVGAFHAGWRGVDGGMARKAVEAFRSEYGIPADRLQVWIGPAISGESYEVSKDLWLHFKETWGEDQLLTDPYRIDLKALNHRQLLESGVLEPQIEISPLCTLRSLDCFSHRRGEALNGRMMGVIALPEKK